jgi:hypothetical protein
MKPGPMLTAVRRNIAQRLGFYPPAGALRVFDDDLFLVSYPKSGNTWVRFLIGDLASRAEYVDFINIERIVPDIYQNREFLLWTIPRPRILKSHECFDSRYRRVIYLVRDPRDVLISYYHYKVMMGDIDSSTPLELYAERFLDGEDRFGSWQEHAESWLNSTADHRDFLLIRYEDLLSDPVTHLSRVAQILGIQRDKTALSAVVARYTVDKMRRLENQQWQRWNPLKGKRAGDQFVRSGTSGSWQRELPSSVARELEIRWGRTMERLGYL